MTKKELLEGLRNCSIIAAIFLLLIAIATKESISWVAILVTTVLTGGFGFLAAEGTTKQKLSPAAVWAGFAFVFTLLAVICS